MPDNWNFEDTLVFETQVLEPYGGAELFVLPFEIPQDENPGYYNFTVFVKLASTGIKVETLEFSVKVEYYADFTEVPSNSTVTGSTSLNHPFKLSVEIVNVSSKFPSFSIVNVIVFWPGAIFISEEVVRVNELVLLTSASKKQT